MPELWDGQYTLGSTIRNSCVSCFSAAQGSPQSPDWRLLTAEGGPWAGRQAKQEGPWQSLPPEGRGVALSIPLGCTQRRGTRD